MTLFESSAEPSRNFVSTCMLGIAALLAGASPAWGQVSLGAASQFSVLGATNVTCTGGSVVIGDIGGGLPLTGGSIAGRALASVALTLTGTTVTGCAALTGGC